VWELANAALERSLNRVGEAGHAARLVRLRTLRPVLRTALLVATVVLLGLTALSEIGVNIAPLLAGAGIVGIAVGFGSQKLVQDVITGLFLLLENAVQVGEWVTVAGLSGIVEDLSIRTIRLRAGDGALHFVPFSAVTSVTNTNRGKGNAAVNVVLAAEEDGDRAGAVLAEIARELRADPAFAALMLSDLQLWGVDRVDGASVTLVGQIVCTDVGRWGVQREFNRRYRKRFAELGIRLALPTQAVRLEQAAAPAPRDGAPSPETTPPAASPPPAALGHES
jgi:small-conductance mechanosensitive channel